MSNTKIQVGALAPMPSLIRRKFFNIISSHPFLWPIYLLLLQNGYKKEKLIVGFLLQPSRYPNNGQAHSGV